MILPAVYIDPATSAICVVWPCPREQMASETDLAFSRRIADKDVPAGVTYRLVLPANLPDRTFRGAWQWDAGSSSVVVSMTLARAIAKARLLVRRSLILSRLRDQLDAAQDAGDTVTATAIVSKRVALRALDTSLDTTLSGISTPDDLAAYTPPEFAGLE